MPSDASRHAMLYIEEVTYGVTPATPALNTLRNTGTTLKMSKDTFQSDEIRSDRQLKCFEHGVKQTGGDINIELSSETYEDLFEAVFMGTWDTDTPITDTDQLKAGVLRRSFTIVRHFTDQVAGDKPYYTFTGCELNTFNLTVGANAIVTGSFGVIGQDLVIDATGPASHTVTGPTVTCPYNSFSGVIKENDVEVAVVTELTLALDNGLAAIFVVGSDTTLNPSVGMSLLTGQLTVYFEDSTLYEKFVDETNTSLEFTLDDGNVELKFIIPNIKFGDATNDVSGAGPITLVLPFQAILDDTEGSQIVIERT